MQTRQRKNSAGKPSSASTRTRSNSSSTAKAKPATKAKGKGKKDNVSTSPSPPSPGQASAASVTMSSTSSSSTKAKAGKKTPAKQVQPLSKEEIKLLKELKSRQGLSSAAAQAADDANIRKRNSAMLAAEAPDEDSIASEEDSAPAPPQKKRRVPPSTQPSPLDSDEENFAAGLSDPIELDVEDKESETESVVEEVDDYFRDVSHTQPVDYNIGPDSNTIEDEVSNGMSVSIEDLEAKPIKIHRRSQSIGSVSTSVSTSATTTPAPPASGSKSNKLTSNDFSPHSYKLVTAAKTRLRYRLSVENPFPDSLNRDIFVWQSISQAAKAGGEESFLVDAFRRSEQNIDQQQKLIEYTWYARGSILGDVKAKAISLISQYYNIPGNLTSKQITAGVGWLVALGHFKYYGADIATQTYDEQRPFRNKIIADVIRLQWFTNQSRGDVLTFQHMVKEKAIPVPLIVLVTTAVEHAIKEWTGGVRVKAHFTDDVARNRYIHHLSSWNKIKKECPNWGVLFPKQLFLDVINGCNMGHLAENFDEEVAEELDVINFSALEDLAKEGKMA